MVFNKLGLAGIVAAAAIGLGNEGHAQESKYQPERSKEYINSKVDSNLMEYFIRPGNGKGRTITWAIKHKNGGYEKKGSCSIDARGTLIFPKGTSEKEKKEIFEMPYLFPYDLTRVKPSQIKFEQHPIVSPDRSESYKMMILREKNGKKKSDKKGFSRWIYSKDDKKVSYFEADLKLDGSFENLQGYTVPLDKWEKISKGDK